MTYIPAEFLLKLHHQDQELRAIAESRLARAQRGTGDRSGRSGRWAAWGGRLPRSVRLPRTVSGGGNLQRPTTATPSALLGTTEPAPC